MLAFEDFSEKIYPYLDGDASLASEVLKSLMRQYAIEEEKIPNLLCRGKFDRETPIEYQLTRDDIRDLIYVIDIRGYGAKNFNHTDAAGKLHRASHPVWRDPEFRTEIFRKSLECHALSIEDAAHMTNVKPKQIYAWKSKKDPNNIPTHVLRSFLYDLEIR